MAKTKALKALKGQGSIQYIQPFIECPSGKFRVLSYIMRVLPRGRRLVEPFCGGCSVWLNSMFKKALLADIDEDLIKLFQHAQFMEDFSRLSVSVRLLFNSKTNSKEAFEYLRKKYNQSNDEMERASILVYLNHHCRSGFMRRSKTAKFNASFVKSKEDEFRSDLLNVFHSRSNACKTVFIWQDFRKTFAKLENGDVVFCDPPRRNDDTGIAKCSYRGERFTNYDARELAGLAWIASMRGTPVVISDSNSLLTQNMYKKATALFTFNSGKTVGLSKKEQKSHDELIAYYEPPEDCI